ncbi:MAG: phage portal protein [Clostridiaceae bacterium]|nr:phage portal protein [Clostridiaceae bacterium]
MEIRSMFNQIFGKQKNQQSQQYTKMEMLNNYMSQFYNFGRDIFADENVRACIDTIARNVAKTKATAIGANNNKLNYLLSIRPNQCMSAYDMFYKTITQLYINNNSFILIQKDNNDVITGFYPVNSSSVDFLESMGYIFVQFTFHNGKKVTVSYDDIVHLRRFFNRNDMYGDSNDAILNTLSLSSTVNQGLANAITTSHNLKGILKYTGSLKPEDLKKQKDMFVADFANINNAGGIAALDSKVEYQQLKVEPVTAEHEQMTIVEEKIYKYFGLNKKIIMGDFDEDVFNSFYESIIEPLLIQLSSEFTHKCFTERERGFGNRIEFSGNRLNYASNSTKVAMIKELLPYSVFTINEARQLFNLESVEGGDIRIQTLNVVNADKANEYQIGEKVNKEKEGEQQ